MQALLFLLIASLPIFASSRRSEKPAPPILPAFGPDSGPTGSNARTEEAAGFVASLVASCLNDVDQSLGIAAPQTPSDADEDVPSDTKLSAIRVKLAEKAETIRSLAVSAGIKGWETDDEKLAKLRARYRSASRDRQLRYAEGDLEYALRRRKLDQIAIDPDAKRMITALKSFLSEFRRARRPAAELADEDPSREWKQRLESFDRDASDLARETRMLDVQLALLKLQEINFDSNLR